MAFVTKSQVIRFDEKEMARKAIKKPADLLKDDWIFVYEKKNEALAD